MIRGTIRSATDTFSAVAILFIVSAAARCFAASMHDSAQHDGARQCGGSGPVPTSFLNSSISLMSAVGSSPVSFFVFLYCYPKVFRLRKFCQRSLPSSYRRLGLYSRQDAKAPSSESFFTFRLCAFARDIPALGCGFAALGNSGASYLPNSAINTNPTPS